MLQHDCRCSFQYPNILRNQADGMASPMTNARVKWKIISWVCWRSSGLNSKGKSSKKPGRWLLVTQLRTKSWR